jgi:amino-acid N-acetyltransferase
MKIRPARAADAEAIDALISTHATDGTVLPRALEEIRGAADHFLVAVDAGRITGCVALECYGGALAEIRSLVVAEDARGTGLGGKLLHAATQRAKEGGIIRLLAVTGTPGFFERHGFSRVSGGIPAEKAARDCSRCAKAAGCRLAALALHLEPGPARPGVLPILQSVRLRRIPGAVPA